MFYRLCYHPLLSLQTFIDWLTQHYLTIAHDTLHYSSGFISHDWFSPDTDINTDTDGQTDIHTQTNRHICYQLPEQKWFQKSQPLAYIYVNTPGLKPYASLYISKWNLIQKHRTVILVVYQCESNIHSMWKQYSIACAGAHTRPGVACDYKQCIHLSNG